MGNSSYLCRGDEVVAAARGAIPVVWLEAFRSSDVKNGEPRAIVKQVLARLAKAKHRDEARMLAQAIGAVRGSTVRIECDEIADLWTRESDFVATLKRALARDARAIRKLSGGELLGGSHIRDVPWEKTPKRKRAPKVPPGKALRDALDEGDVMKARALLRDGADPNYSDAFGTCWGSIVDGVVPASMLDALIAAGADVNLRQRVHGPPLVQAAWANNVAIARALVKRGANVHLADVFKRPAIAIAARENAVAMVKMLLAAKPSDADLRIATREATKTNAAAALRLLLRR